MPRAARQATSGSEPPAKRVKKSWPKSIPFVVFDKDKFSVDPRAVEFLESLGSVPLGVAVLVGPYRHGKSFLLNRIILQHKPGDGFMVGQTVNACTKGLHLSTQLLESSNSSDGDYAILVLDTEGLGAMTATDTHDARIFSMALLLSSMFMYNSKGTIDQPAINNLSLVANISDHIRTSTSGGGGDDLSTFMPSFLWIVRDFALDLVDEGGQSIEQADYLDRALCPVEGADAEKNKVRTSLRNFFKHRDCVTMIRPCDDEKMLKTLNTQPDSALKPEFVVQAKALRQKILQQTRPKIACGTHLTGTLLARLATIYCDAINKGAVPAIQDSWSLISADECHRAVLAAEQAFAQHLAEHKADGTTVDERGDRIAVPAPVLESLFTQGFERALSRYKALAIGDKAEEFREQLRDALRKHAARIRSENMQVITRKAESMCVVLDETLLDQPSFDEVRKMFHKLEASFVQQVGADSACRAAWDGQAARRVWDWASRFHGELATQCAGATAKASALEMQQSQAQRQAEQHMQRVAVLEKESAELKSQARDVEAAREDAERRLGLLRQEIAQHADELDAAEQRSRTQIQELQETLTATTSERDVTRQAADALAQKLTQAQHELDALRTDAAAVKSELDELRGQRKAHAEQAQRLQELAEANANLSRRNDDMALQMDRAAEHHRAELSGLHAETKTTLHHLQAAKEEAVGRARTATEALKTASDELKKTKAELAARTEQHTREIRRLASEAEKAAALREEERAEAKRELSEVRAEASNNVKRFQQQLEENSAQHREELRKRNATIRVEQDKLFQEKVTAVSRAQNAEARLTHTEEALRETREQLAREREKAREENYLGKINELESRLATANTRNELMQASLTEKADLIAEQQTRTTELEGELRQIQQRHDAEKMRMELDHARKIGAIAGTPTS